MTAASWWPMLFIGAAALGAVACALGLVGRARGPARAVLAVGVATGAFALTSRGLDASRVPIQNLFESMTALGVLAGGLALLLSSRQHGSWLVSAGGAALAGVLGGAMLLPVPGRSIEPEAAILSASPLLVWHVGAVLTGYACITLGFLLSATYLVLAASGARAVGALDRLHALDRLQVLVLNIAFWTLGVGILLGAWWADSAWGRWWAFDPKETWALLTWAVYLAVVHARLLVRGKAGVVTAWLSVLGFLLMLWSYFGVNLLMSGLHSYA